jgi:hypothetical protein
MRFCIILVVAAALLTAASTASGSELVARNATNVKLAVNGSGKKALLTYKVDGKTRHTLVWGAINALTPNQTQPQVEFQIDYTGGGKRVWKRFRNRCKSYDGPELPFLVVACKARDGSYWAVQKWQYWLPFFGYQPWLPYQDDTAFHVSHWSGPPALLELWADWIDTAQGGKAPHNLFGRLTYGGVPVYGYKILPGGVPGDGYGRVVYVDSLDSLLGAGWWRLTGILSRNPSGTFCHAMIPLPTYSNYPNPHVVDAGNGTQYRAYVEGPGVTPAVMTEIADPGNFDPSDAAKVTKQKTGLSLLQQWSAPPTCLKGH